MKKENQVFELGAPYEWLLSLQSKEIDELFLKHEAMLLNMDSIDALNFLYTTYNECIN